MAKTTSTPIPVSSSSASIAATDGDGTITNLKTEKGANLGPTPSNSSKKRTASQINDESDDDEDEYVTSKKTKTTPKSTTKGSGKRKANTNPNRAIPMGRTYEQCAEHDKKLIDMRNAGKSWAEVRKEWTKLTGETTASSTLPNRYSRLKSNFVVIKEEDNPVLIEAKQEVEAGFEREKWSLIAKAMEEKGTEKYRPDSLSKQYKKLMVFAKELQSDNTEATRTTRTSGGAVEYNEEASDDDE